MPQLFVAFVVRLAKRTFDRIHIATIQRAIIKVRGRDELAVLKSVLVVIHSAFSFQYCGVVTRFEFIQSVPNLFVIFIGDNSGSWTGANPASPTTVVNNLTNAMAIGVQSQVTVSNAMALGGVGAYAVKVGIGLTNPAYPLDIRGVVNMRVSMNSPSIKVNDRDFMGIGEGGEFWVSNFKMKYENEGQWSDKVFEKNYKLLTINELAQFIDKNNHLPNIPSAKEVVKNGIDNTEMTAKLLEKIEEMSLYIIQLEKRVNQLENKK